MLNEKKTLARIGIIGIPFDTLSMEEAIAKVSAWGMAYESKYVTFVNVHSAVTANYDENYLNIIHHSDLVAPDGAPIAWMLRRVGFKNQRRVCGPDFFWSYLKHAEKNNESIFLYGTTVETLSRLTANINKTFPKLIIAGSYSPPFRYVNHIEDESVIKMINDSKANTVWVSLGCPKQEVWMINHTKKLNAVLLGVGAAFNFYAGTSIRAPMWMRNNGLEWLHRLLSEPIRLGERYLFTNTIFILKSLKQLYLHQLKEKQNKTSDSN